VTKPAVKPTANLAQRLLGGLILLLVIAYPFTLHLGILGNENLQPALVILLGLIILSALSMILRRNWMGWVLLSVGIALTVWLISGGVDSSLVLKLPPLLINLFLAALFSSTLLPGKRALISRIAEMMHGQKLDPVAERYTRRMTLFWALLFVAILLETLLLTLFASAEIWSLFTNFINYAIVGLVFLVEYRIRIHKLSHLQHMSFSDFIISLRRIDWRNIQ
jgi:uncharacterized membrane protein